MYYNYHAQAKQLISDGHLTSCELIERHNDITPCLLLYFDNHKPVPIREHRWSEYFELMGACI